MNVDKIKKIQIKLINGQTITTIVDDFIYNELKQYDWCYNGNGYIRGLINGKRKYLHRFIINAGEREEVDHINNNTLDNRLVNLRIVNRSQNNMNRPNTAGVWFSKQKEKWVADIPYKGKKYHLGLFKSKMAAIAVRNAAELKYFGEFACKQKQQYRIGLTFGCFDMLHYGHINLLNNIKKRVDVLIVCVSDTQYSLKYKNKKPIISLKNRLKTVYALDVVDAVGVQSLKFGKKEAIAKYHPTFLFVGNDHKHDYSGMNLGVPVEFLPYTKGISSTMLREKGVNLQLSSLK